MQIQTWTDGYVALRQRAEELRGAIETANAQRWPITTGGDVVAIAALVDPAVRVVCARRGDHGIAARWSTTTDDIARFGLPAPSEPYSESRSFWATLAAVSVYLDSVAARVPAPAMWSSLIDKLGDVVEHRNAEPTEEGSIVHFAGIESFDKLWTAQKKYLEKKRGADNLDPPAGFPGVAYPIPRTTNADVLQLAAYWTNTLADARELMGYDGVKQRWQVALADVDNFAKTGKPDEVYPHNNEFWRTSWQVAVQAAVSKEAPTKWDLFVDMVKDTFTHLPSEIASGAKTVASGTMDVLEGGANAVGKVANAAGRGLFSGVGAPLMIGAGLVGIYFLTRSRGHDQAEA
jgi:hypothetical protein